MRKREPYETILWNMFDKEKKNNTYIYEKRVGNEIFLCEWKNGFAYKAPYRFLSSTNTTIEEVSHIIENVFRIQKVEKEYAMFLYEPLLVEETICIKPLTFKEESLIEEMKQQCCMEEIEIANIQIHDIHVLGAFVGDVLVGASSIEAFWGAYDIAVLVHPKYRQQGIAKALVSANANWILKERKICMYRCEKENLASYRTAQSLGFKKEIELAKYSIERNV